MRLITSSLHIKPLNLFELESLIESLQSRSELDFAVLPNRYRNQLFTDCLMNDIKSNITKRPLDYLFHTIWLIINKENKLVSGHVFFSGSPNQCGEIELYTEIFDELNEHQFMRESLNAMIAWAAELDRIKLIRINIPVNNNALSQIMTESGFEKLAQYQHFENWIWKNQKNQ
jgi:[ribosomal protein S5]-alanine N-acetyltransferase